VAPNVLTPAQTEFGAVWRNWWLANLTGTLVVTPFSVLWLTSLGSRIRWREFGESVVILSLFTGVCLVLFGGWYTFAVRVYPLHFMCVPFLLWMAFRLGCRGTATGVVLLSVIATWGTVRDWGPFAYGGATMEVVQAYISMMSVTGIVLAAVVTQHKRAEQQLLALATTDSLTGLANHRRLLEVLRAEITRSNRTGRSFVVAFMDMDGLKEINDQFGHLIGSRAICRVADALRASCRATDTPARYGGDELAVVLPETNEVGGRLVLGRITALLDADRNGPRVSVSGGVAVFPRDGETPTLLLRTADRLLYEAKARRSARPGSMPLEPETTEVGIG
jgi:diguanylate cyclase (GGDEF)-like protein